MKDNKVGSVSVDEWLANLRTSEWLIPMFQRDFVWGIPEVCGLAESVLAGRPIGMVTVWEQPDESDLPLEGISLVSGKTTVLLGGTANRPNRFYAVLDGRQRSQAAAMAFGGLRSADQRSKYAGRFVLDTTTLEEAPRVRFIHDSEAHTLRLQREADYLAKGLFPLSSPEADEGVVSRWLRYSTAIVSPDTYPDAKLPDKEVLAVRRRIVQDAFDGLTRTRLAVYTVPSHYVLGEICEIFETLNTTGWKVSTVDLIHSALYSETHKLQSPMLLRDWIAELGDMDGATGWATRKERPELMVQIAAACYLADANPPTPRKMSGAPKRLTSIKASDLLALPTVHWQAVRENAPLLATALRDFQRVVGARDSLFGFLSSPYPVTAGLYVALRWRHSRETADVLWDVSTLDSVFRAFFWRNALLGRYDQGFLTQFGRDLEFLIDLLEKTPGMRRPDWHEEVDERFERHFGPRPTIDHLTSLVLDGRVTGAVGKALALPMRCRVTSDLLDRNTHFAYPESVADLHHIYPKQWCKDNSSGRLGQYLEQNSDRDPVSAIANLMPLSRTSNNAWRTKSPATALQEHGVTAESHREVLRDAFIDATCLGHLKAGAERAVEFWAHRAGLIAADLENRMRLSREVF